MDPKHADGIIRMLRSLDGLSVGDALGECFFKSKENIANRLLPPTPWHWSDDTAMAIGIVNKLTDQGVIFQDELAWEFANNYKKAPNKGYGPKAKQILTAISQGVAWKAASSSVFSGQGSCGNGSAMRVGPLGAYFAENRDKLLENARLSAEVTHSHPEGIAGSIAIALASAFACNNRTNNGFLEFILKYTPTGEVHSGIKRVADESNEELTPYEAAIRYGNGYKITCQNTVPYALWCANKHYNNYVDAIWAAIACLGDMDTMAAIVGSIVVHNSEIPENWLMNLTPLTFE